jgi:LPXTG-motif cell wall-anchored protein
MSIANSSIPVPPDTTIADATASSNPTISPFLVVLVIAAVAIAGAGLLIYFKKNRKY